MKANRVEIALEYASERHMGQKRKDGTPYIFHPMWVADYLIETGITDEDYIIAALVHDLLEDTDATEKAILSYSNMKVLEDVKLLTKTKDNKDIYIEKILKNDIAKAVKNADRIHNLKCARTADLDFVKRYLINTKENYLGKFSKELDREYESLKKMYDNRYTYIIDTSVDDSPVYRTNESTACVFDRKNREWIPCDKYFWTELGDDAKNITEEEAIKLISSK